MSEYIRKNLKEKIKTRKDKRYSLLDLALSAKPLSAKTTNVAGNFDKYLPEELR